MDIVTDKGADTAGKDFSSLYLSLSNIFSAQLSALNWLGNTLTTLDNDVTHSLNFLPDAHCLDSNDVNADLTPEISALVDNDLRLDGLDAGFAPMREYVSDKEGEQHYCGDITTNYDIGHPGALDLPHGVSRDVPQSLEIFHSNVQPFAQALNEHLLVAIIDSNGLTTYVNEKFCTVFKYSNREILGQHCRVLNSECHSGAQLGEIWNTVRRGAIWKGELGNRAKDGVTHWLEAIVIPCSDHIGKIYQYIAICTDITGRKRNEDALCASRNELRALANHLEQVQEHERKRIAREIHDELGQHLLALKMDVSSIYANTLGKNQLLNAKLQLVLQGIDETMRHVKSIITDLRPTALDLGLIDAIQSHVKAFERRSGIACELLLSGDHIELTGERITVLFRVLQESLVNISRHAQASRTSVALYRQVDCVFLEVSDNGRGIAEDAYNKRKSFGMLGMRERLEALGGALIVESAASGGTKLIASLPLTE